MAALPIDFAGLFLLTFINSSSDFHHQFFLSGNIFLQVSYS